MDGFSRCLQLPVQEALRPLGQPPVPLRKLEGSGGYLQPFIFLMGPVSQSITAAPDGFDVELAVRRVGKLLA
jgi:hypothetical protein